MAQKTFQGLLKSLLNAGVGLHDYSCGLTPLGLLADPYIVDDEPCSGINNLIQIWLLWLEEYNVDIACYLQREYELYWYSRAYPFIRKHYCRENRHPYRKFWGEYESFLLFDFTEADPKKSVTVFVKMMYDSRDDNKERVRVRNISGSWRD